MSDEGKPGASKLPWPVTTLVENAAMLSGSGDSPANKRLSVEKIYQKKSQLEHILLRPDTYIGSVEPQTTSMWVMNQEEGRMEQREITYVPGLYKIFDEILVNAADNKQRDANMNCIKIDIDAENNSIKIWNNGKGIPVVEHKDEKMYVPTLIFGHLLTSSNYNDFEKKVTGGRNGYGAKLCNIFSKKFTVETSCKQSKKCFKQVWTDNMSKAGSVKLGDAKDNDYTCVTFEPDLKKFKMEGLDKDIVALFTRRAYDVAASGKGVKVYLNGKKLPVNKFRDYVELYLKDVQDESGQPLKVVYEQVNDRWEVAVALSAEKGFQQVSFVNSIATTKGGRHVDYVVDQLTKKLGEVVNKKSKGSVPVKPFQIKNNMWVFINCLIENPSFDSQTKENMTLQMKQFGSKCELSEKFVTQVTKCGIIEHILNWVKFKAQDMLNKKCSTSKHSKLKGIPKLDDANEAGTKQSEKCTLILTEGDSAKTLAVAGLSVVGRDYYGVFPLRGKCLNTREATTKQIMENVEINNLIKIIGLQYKLKYTDFDEVKKLRYGKIMIMTDQDQDGSHIKGLIINFIHHNWPNLLKHNFLVEFITPIVKVSKSKKELAFYSLPEFDEWKQQTDNWHTWKIKYYKGLGTSTAKEAKEYFSDMSRHRIPFRYMGPEDDSAIELAFSKKNVEERKMWLSNWMEQRKQKAELGMHQDYLYGKDTKRITFSEFINKELILFSNMDLERSIPSLVDGFKPGQRKVLFTCIKRNLVKELKVAQLAGSVAELSAYHHGEQSLMGTIINLAQNFVGSNNLNLLQPIGQFGTRLHGGKDSASPRYIFTCLSELSRHIFHPHDDAILAYLNDDGSKIEPIWYCPILPMVLVNGAQGIGTGWSTYIPNYDVRDIVANLRRLLKDEPMEIMKPSYRGFRGIMDDLEDQRYLVSGEVAILNDETFEITELPVGTWTQNYKESVLEPLLQGTDKVPAMLTDYKEYHTDTTVRFVVKMSQSNLAKAKEVGIHKMFKLQTVINTTSMVLFDAAGCIKRYNTPTEILQEFYSLRLEFYGKRKNFLDGMLDAEARKLSNQARFILEKIDGTVVLENKPKREVIQMLKTRKYESDPVKAWKLSQNKDAVDTADETEESEEAADDAADYGYILSMALMSLSKEKKEELIKQRDAKIKELQDLRKKSPKDLWNDDLDAFMLQLKKVEDQDVVDAKTSSDKQAKSQGKLKSKDETQPSRTGQRVVPTVDEAKKKLKDVTKAPKKKKEDPMQNKLDSFGFAPDDEDDIMEIKTSPAAEEPKPAQKAKAKPRVKKDSTDKPKSPEKSPVRRSPAKKQTKTGKRRELWETDSEGDGTISDGSELDLSEVVAPREKVPRRQAAAKVTYKFDSDEELESVPASSDTENGGATTNGISKASRAKALVSDDDLEDPSPEKSVAVTVPSSGSKAAVKKPTSATTTTKSTIQNEDGVDGSDVISLSDGNNSDFEPKQPINSKPAASKSKQTVSVKQKGSSDKSSDEKPKPAPKKRQLLKTSTKTAKALISDDELENPSPEKSATLTVPSSGSKAAVKKPTSATTTAKSTIQSEDGVDGSDVVSLSDGNDSDFEPKQPMKSKPTAYKSKQSVPVKQKGSSDKSSDEKPKPAPKKRQLLKTSDKGAAADPKQTKLTFGKSAVNKDSAKLILSDSDDELVKSPPGKKQAAVKQASPVKKGGQQTAATKKPADVPVVKSPARKREADDSDSEVPKAKRKAPAKKPAESDSEVELDASIPVTARNNAARTKKPVKYDFGSDSDDDW